MTPPTQFVARVLLLPMFVVAAAFVVKAAHASGDGFSAGVLAGTAVLLQYVAFGHRACAARMRIAPVGVRAGLFGLALMVGVAFASTLGGEPPLSHQPAPGESVATVLGIAMHSAVLFDAGVALLVFGLLVSIVELVAEQQEESA